MRQPEYKIDTDRKDLDFAKSLKQVKEDVERLKRAKDIDVKDAVFLKPISEYRSSLITKREAINLAKINREVLMIDISSGRLQTYTRGKRVLLDREEVIEFYKLK
tara:strand:+ start:682 stop:996 length:315 start_codon:yes stop_codon:yes gene_type:complete